MNDFPHRYSAAVANELELRWQETWEREGTYHTPNPVGDLKGPDGVEADGRPKRFVMDMFPFPSGAGLHVGHPLGYIATDAYARFRRMCGDNVLHTMGYDAFGLPTEQYAIQTGQRPEVTTEHNVATMRAQLRRLGLGHDDRRSVSTTDDTFYRWTQWIFLQLYGSWYDVSAEGREGGTGRARPISELIEEFERGDRQPTEGRAWASLSPDEQAAEIDRYRLAYRSTAAVNWCPGLGTVLANEEVTAEGRSERGNFPVFPRQLPQWMMRITAYAERLLTDLDHVNWPEPVKTMQRHWIGRSTGARIRFQLQGQGKNDVDYIDVFTTRPDTLAGATFMVLAPEHPMATTLAAAGQWDDQVPAAWRDGADSPSVGVAAYRERAARTADLDRSDESRTKTGVFTGTYALHPLTQQPIPVFVSDYVLMGYGTGAIMAVPAEDTRDHAFALVMGLPIVRTIQPPADHPEDQPYLGDGPSINSNYGDLQIDGLSKDEAIATTIAWLEQHHYGEAQVSFKLRDWLFSRQRYWGEPFPIVYDEQGRVHALPSEQLPVRLPVIADYAPEALDPDDATSEPRPPLARAADWVNVELDLGDGLKRYTRETNTMPNWAGSCWYYLRYIDPTNAEALVDPRLEQYWMDGELGAGGGVDLYVGGVEHAVLHLLYARFWHKVMFDLGIVSTREPFRTLFNQGYVQAHAFRDDRGQPVPAAEVVEEQGADGVTVYTWQGQPVTREYGKMGKSLKNVVTPDEVCRDYGADTFRVYEMSMGPLELSRPWETRAVVGAERFLQRVWRNIVDEVTGELVVTDEETPGDLLRSLHKTIDGVRSDLDGLRFNTAVAKLIEFNNALTKAPTVPRDAADALVRMVAPLAPHIAEELWHRLGHTSSVVYAPFPVADPALAADDVVTCVVQINGKVRHRLEVPAAITEDQLLATAQAEEKVAALLVDATVRKTIVRPPTLVNIVIG